jgi:hypothetical protein
MSRCVLTPFHLRTETDPDFETSRFYYQEHRTMEKVQKPSNSVYYTPSSEPYKIYSARELLVLKANHNEKDLKNYCEKE